MENLDKMLNGVFTTLTDQNSSLFIFVTLFTALYGGKAAPPLPQVFVDLFTEPWFRIIVLSLIAYGANSDPQTAIMSSVLFMIIMNNLNNFSF